MSELRVKSPVLNWHETIRDRDHYVCPCQLVDGCGEAAGPENTTPQYLRNMHREYALQRLQELQILRALREARRNVRGVCR